MRGCGAGFESRVWRTDEGVVQPRVQYARPDDDDEHEQEGVDVAEEVERRDARLGHIGLQAKCIEVHTCADWLHGVAGSCLSAKPDLGHEGNGDGGDRDHVVDEEGDARALVDLAREAHRDLLADEGREAGPPESLVES
eukprot:scaffold30357_cov52-Phaeocystis_antarctica.AAC.3